MKKLNYLLFIILLIVIIPLSAQEIIKISFDNLYYEDYHFAEKKNYRHNILFQLTDNKIYDKNSKSYHNIVLPKGFSSKKSAYGFNYFTGKNNGKLENNILFIVDDYTSSNPNIYFDLNNNLDFTDDGDALSFNKDSSIEFRIPNYEYKDTYSHRELIRANSSKADIDYLNNLYKANSIYKDKAKLLPADYWLATIRKNNRIIDIKVKGVIIKIGLHDYNSNGLFSDIGQDRVLIGNYEKQYISPDKNDGAQVYNKGMFLNISKRTYEILSIEPTGKYIIIKENNKKNTSLVKTTIGEQILNYKMELVESPRKILYLKDIFNKKYILIDLWGTWCKPCIASIPKLKKLQQDYKKLQIIGLNYGDRNKEKVEKFITQKGINWVNGYLTKEMKDKLKIEGFPSYFLINNSGEVLVKNGNLKDVIKQLNNN